MLSSFLETVVIFNLVNMIIKNNKLTLKINGNDYKITSTKKNVEVRCRNNTV